MKRKLFLIIIILVNLSLIGCQKAKQTKTNWIVKIKNHKIFVELAQTTQEKYQGLSHRHQLCPYCGMLFVYPTAQERVFVMRNMNFPLDIIWIKDKKIVNINRNIQPEKAPLKKYLSKQPVDLVLEVNGDFCRKNNIEIGDRIEIKTQP
ncbi:MAG: DUF192 domain-containing protein [Desulfosudaceae bacterium]